MVIFRFYNMPYGALAEVILPDGTKLCSAYSSGSGEVLRISLDLEMLGLNHIGSFKIRLTLRTDAFTSHVDFGMPRACGMNINFNDYFRSPILPEPTLADLLAQDAADA